MGVFLLKSVVGRGSKRREEERHAGQNNKVRACGYLCHDRRRSAASLSSLVLRTYIKARGRRGQVECVRVHEREGKR